ncbi:STAS domain-containing protein [Pseudonocardia sp. DR1-2]|uniref:STAS domain-containing protein n=1 Tax=Pseudonocardia sp. DR1-2 TaxID=2951168 RepID=UPI002043915F|nr:STAS domain-containing protein [Pseudonocardia sp. DR1-2]MCM3847098.1 STAS domain-containing protein [Pseudonocardia sp. DR1-2]
MNDHLLTADTPRTGTYRVRVSGVFDTAAGAHLLRQLDAWARDRDTVGGTTRTVVADLTGVTAVSAAGLKAIPHAVRTVSRRGCAFTVVGAEHLLGRVPPAARPLLRPSEAVRLAEPVTSGAGSAP